jgi:hypothetical protein
MVRVGDRAGHERRNDRQDGYFEFHAVTPPTYGR